MFVALLVSFCAFACDKETGEEQAAAKDSAATEKKASKPAATKKDGKRDRGEGSMMIDQAKWVAKSARAKVGDGKLTLSFRRSDGDPSKNYIRQSLDLKIGDYKGPGDYVLTGFEGSQSDFVVVGFSAEAASSAELDTKLAEAFSNAKLINFNGAKVTIASADDAEIRGTFSHESGQTKVTEGTFRATVR